MYEYARTGEKVELEARQIEIYNIDLLEYKEKNVRFIVSCSKGTYIRSLCEDIASKLNTVGYMKNLKRLQVGNFNIENAICIDELNLENVNEYMYTLEDMLKENESMNLNEYKLKLFLNGVKLSVNNLDGIYKIYAKSNFIGTGTVKNSLLKRDIILIENI